MKKYTLRVRQSWKKPGSTQRPNTVRVERLLQPFHFPLLRLRQLITRYKEFSCSLFWNEAERALYLIEYDPDTGLFSNYHIYYGPESLGDAEPLPGSFTARGFYASDMDDDYMDIVLGDEPRIVLNRCFKGLIRVRALQVARGGPRSQRKRE
jgi:hypothetical protein